MESQAQPRPPESAVEPTSSDDTQAHESVRSALGTPHLKCNIFVSVPHHASHGTNFENIVLSDGKQHDRIPSRKTSLFRHS